MEHRAGQHGGVFASPDGAGTPVSARAFSIRTAPNRRDRSLKRGLHLRQQAQNFGGGGGI